MMRRLILIFAAFLFTAGCGRHGENGRLKLTGTIETTTVAVSFRVPGRLSERLVDEGQQVRAGDVVARLDDSELRDADNAAIAEQRGAQAALADLRAGSRREEIAAASAALARLTAEADRAGRDARRAEALFAKEVIPRKELDAAVAARDATAAAVREGSERLRLTQIGPRPDAVKQAQARLQAAEAARALADTHLADAVLRAPLTGTVLAKHAEPGELLAAGAPVLTVARLDEVWVRAYVPETQLGRIKLGQPATVTSDTWKGRSYRGRVSFIASEAEFTPKNVQTEQERVKLVYRIKVTIANPQQELKPGMPVDVVIAAP